MKILLNFAFLLAGVGLGVYFVTPTNTPAPVRVIKGHSHETSRAQADVHKKRFLHEQHQFSGPYEIDRKPASTGGGANLEGFDTEEAKQRMQAAISESAEQAMLNAMAEEDREVLDLQAEFSDEDFAEDPLLQQEINANLDLIKEIEEESGI